MKSIEAIDILSDLHIEETKWKLFQRGELYRFLNSEIKRAFTLVILGDIFDERLGANSFLLTEFQKFLEDCVKKYRFVILITGNHDKEQDDVMYSFSTVYKHIKGVIVCDDFQMLSSVDFKGYPIDNVKFLIAPFFTNKIWYDKFKQTSNSFRDKKDIVVLGHKTLPNFYYDSKKKRKSGGVKIDLTPFKRVFLGDNHYRQKRNNIYVVGSFYQENFGEDTNKGVLRYYYNEDRVVKIFNTKEFYKTFEYDFKKDKHEIIENISNDLENCSILNVKVIIKGTLNDILFIPEQKFREDFKDKFSKLKFDFKIEKETERANFETEDNKDFFKNDFNDYCKLEKMSNKQIKYGRRLLNV